MSLPVIAARYLDESNAEQVFDAMKRKTKTETREVLAHMFPRPDAPTLELEVTGALPTSDGRGFIDPATGKTVRSRIEPSSATGHLVQLTMTTEGYATYQRAKQLMSHRIPDGDPVKVIEAALKVLVEKLERERMGKTSRPQKKRRPSKPGHIANETKREVFERDGFQCTYVDAQGRRCECKTRLELDHIVPRAHEGSDEAANLRVRCKPHNRLWAEEVFGKEHVAQAIESRREAQEAKSESADPVVQPAPPVSLSLETIDHTTRGLLNMGFAKPDVKRAIDDLVRRHHGDARPVGLPDLIREAIAVLT